MRQLALILSGCLLASPVPACETALLLAVDVSGSISGDEYLLQMQGLADAIEAPEIADALVYGQVSLSLMHWSGLGYHQQSLPWQAMRSYADVSAFAASTRRVKRPLNYTATALGQAIRFSIAQFADVPGCRRQVIDISGDGEENDGMSLPAARAEAEMAGITINAIAIEVDNQTTLLTGYFQRYVITSNGFVMTAMGLRDYPRAIYEKLLRELSKAST